jgi:hypothetical protein
MYEETSTERPDYVAEISWEIVTADIFEWDHKHHLVIVDSYSGWYDIA